MKHVLFFHYFVYSLFSVPTPTYEFDSQSIFEAIETN